MNTKEAVKSLQEYVNVPIAELTESGTNPRKTFNEERLAEFAQSIRSQGVLSPLLVRRTNDHLEIVSGARRFAPRSGELVEHFCHEAATPVIPPKPGQTCFINRNNSNVIRYGQRTSSPHQSAPRVQLQSRQPPVNEHSQRRRNEQKTGNPAKMTESAGCSRIILAGHPFPGHA